MRHIIFLNGIWKNKETDPLIHFTRTIGPYQLKHWLSHFGIGSQVIDFCQIFTAQEIVNLIEHFKGPETFAIGISTTFWSGSNGMPENIHDTILMIREKFPELKIIGGGARLPPKISHHLFDHMMSGESEDKLVAWYQEMLGKKGMSLFNKKFDITNLSHRFDDRDAIMHGEVLPIELGRGCVFKCKFCAHRNLGKPKHTYQRQHRYLVEEMAYNLENFGTTYYNFLDDTVNEDVDKIRNLSTLSKDLGQQINWTGYLRADLIWAKKETAALLQESGMRTCFFGIETFNPTAASAIDKGWAPKHGKKFLPELYHNIWGGKINMHISLIVGLPGEGVESLNDTLLWALDNPIGWHWFNSLTLYTEKKDSETMSEFTKNYDKYGYRNVSDNGHWENDFMTSEKAMEIAQHFNSIAIKSVNRMSSWSSFSAVNLGYNIEDVMTWDMSKFIENVEVAHSTFKQKYLSALMAIRN
jgi:hypothetical protein